MLQRKCDLEIGYLDNNLPNEAFVLKVSFSVNLIKLQKLF